MGKVRPHLVRYWLHSSEKTENPEAFSEKVNEICSLYHGAVPARENGAHTISVDEMTGIQALEHKYPDKPAMPGKTARMEFEYIRHGTTGLIGFFDVATGRMEITYLNKTCTEGDFVETVRKLAETDPQASWTFTCDGLNTHKSEMLVRFAAGQCGITDGLGEKGKNGILKSLSSRADFLHDKNHRIRFYKVSVNDYICFCKVIHVLFRMEKVKDMLRIRKCLLFKIIFRSTSIIFINLYKLLVIIL